MALARDGACDSYPREAGAKGVVDYLMMVTMMHVTTIRKTVMRDAVLSAQRK